MLRASLQLFCGLCGRCAAVARASSKTVAQVVGSHLFLSDLLLLLLLLLLEALRRLLQLVLRLAPARPPERELPRRGLPVWRRQGRRRGVAPSTRRIAPRVLERAARWC